MPLDNIMYESADAAFKRRCIGWEIKLCLWPRKCYYTNKSLWLRKAYIGTSMLTGPGEPIFDYRWVHAKEFLFLKIKGTV